MRQALEQLDQAQTLLPVVVLRACPAGQGIGEYRAELRHLYRRVRSALQRKPFRAQEADELVSEVEKHARLVKLKECFGGPSAHELSASNHEGLAAVRQYTFHLYSFAATVRWQSDRLEWDARNPTPAEHDYLFGPGEGAQQSGDVGLGARVGDAPPSDSELGVGSDVGECAEAGEEQAGSEEVAEGGYVSSSSSAGRGGSGVQTPEGGPAAEGSPPGWAGARLTPVEAAMCLPLGLLLPGQARTGDEVLW